MELSLFLAKVVGCYFILAGLAIVTQKRHFNSLMLILAENIYQVYLLSFLPLIIGLLLIISHNVWVLDWRVIITITGWIVFSKGILWIFFTDYAKKTLSWWKNSIVLNITGLIAILLGACLVYHGFDMHTLFKSLK